MKPSSRAQRGEGAKAHIGPGRTGLESGAARLFAHVARRLHTPTGVSGSNTPPEKKRRGKVSFRSTKPGAG